MIRSVGLDIVEIARVRRNMERFGDRFIYRILGREETVQYGRRRNKEAYLAGRLAAKEAVIKGLGCFLKSRPPLKSIQIVNDTTGAPRLTLPTEVQRQLGAAGCVLSITHEKKYAAAVAVFEESS
ncbi:MAG: holo-ACP synthase [Candidatus Zixiibacteriota bacterium]